MKILPLASLLLLSTTVALAAAKMAAGPKGGRLLDTAPHQAEFFVTKERRVEVTFYDAARKPVAPGTQVLTVIAEPKSGRMPLDLEKTATGFRSTQPLPAGEPYRVVVQVREDPTSRPKNYRIEFNLETCAECQHAEYACTCEH